MLLYEAVPCLRLDAGSCPCPTLETIQQNWKSNTQRCGTKIIGGLELFREGMKYAIFRSGNKRLQMYTIPGCTSVETNGNFFQQ